MNRFVFFVLCGITTALTAQELTPRFEVASIKENTSRDFRASYSLPPTGRVSIINARLRDIVAQAFQVNVRFAPYLIQGGSDQLLATRFDINAKPPDGAPAGQVHAMLRMLLAERFNLSAHIETRPVPIFALKMANEGRMGPNLRASKYDCAEYRKARTVNPSTPEPTDANGRGWCVATIATLPDGMSFRDAGTLDQLIRDIQNDFDRPIADRTGLRGLFEWELAVQPSLGGRGLPWSNLPLMPTALREQLGVKLESEMAPYDVVVIDSVELPMPN